MERVMNNVSIDVHKCTGCRNCELVCSYLHEGVFAPSLSRIRVVRILGHGLNGPGVCVNCGHPPCVEVCPTGAAHLDRTMPVIRIDEEECIGCGECVAACPFGAIDLNEEKGVAFTCDLCDGNPACVAVCNQGALTLGRGQRLAGLKRDIAAKARLAGIEAMGSE
jgi:carbon-monoxide dehydrogenase iron sulfur subunit